MSTIFIERRFQGPPTSGNGGYTCGLLARYVGPSAEVTLRNPPPLDKLLNVVPVEVGVELRDGEVVLAAGKAVEFEKGSLPNATFSEAQEAAARTPYTAKTHKLPMCFVCGPQRKPGNGLRIFAGPLEGCRTSAGAPFASHWVPAKDLSQEDGLIGEEFLWAALDCPTGYAVLGGGLEGITGKEPILLGRLSARIQGRPSPGEKCVITAKAVARDGRKLLADGMLFGERGTVLAFARATWILVNRDVQLGVPT